MNLDSKTRFTIECLVLTERCNEKHFHNLFCLCNKILKALHAINYFYNSKSSSHCCNATYMIKLQQNLWSFADTTCLENKIQFKLVP